MKLYSWNVNGIRAVIKKELFFSFIDEYQPDVLCLQETKAHQEQVELELEGYTQVWHSADKKGYSSTLILSKEEPEESRVGFPEKILKKYNWIDSGERDFSREGRVIAVKLKSFWVVTVYTPNSKGDLSRLDTRHKVWDKAFLEYMKILEKTAPVIFCGDLNVAHKEIDLARPKENRGKHGFSDEEREGFDNFLEAGFIDTLREFNTEPEQYSWWTHWGGARARNVGWRIDYFLVSKSLKSKLVGAAIHPDVMGSDHCPVSLEIKG